MAAAVLLVLVLAGCGDQHEKLYPVSGKVTFQGKPVSAGVIRFHHLQAPVDMFAVLGPDGSYEVIRGHGPGLLEGTYQVAILPPLAPDRPADGMMRPPTPVKCADIPEKYRLLATSGLTVEVKSGTNRFDIDMKP